MNEIIKSTTDLIEQGGEFLKQPAVAGLFSGLKNWVSDLLTRNKAAKEKLAVALKAKDQLIALQANLEFMEKWNNEMQAELEAKAKEIDTFAKRAGLDLTGAKIEKAIVGSNDFQNVGNISIGDNQTHGSKQTDIDKIATAVTLLKKGVTTQMIQTMSPELPLEWLQKLEKAIKE